MAYLTESGKKLLKEALFRLNLDDDNWSLPEVIGVVIGERISLLGCTNNRQSLNQVFVTIQRIVSEINELRTFRTETAVRTAKELVLDRYNHFFEGIHYGNISYNSFEAAKNQLTQRNPGEVVSDVVDVMRKVLEGAGIMTIIHNQEQEEATPTPPPANEPPVSAEGETA